MSNFVDIEPECIDDIPVEMPTSIDDYKKALDDAYHDGYKYGYNDGHKDAYRQQKGDLF